MNRLVAGASIALLLGACSSNGSGAKQPEDEFLDKVEAVCRDASSKIRKLDAGDVSAPADLRDIISDADDSLGDLKAPSTLGKQFDAYTSAFDDEVTMLGKVVTAASSGNTTTESSAVAAVNDAGIASDKLVDALGAIRCRGLIPLDALTHAADDTIPTDVTTPSSDSTPSTETAPTDATVAPTDSTAAPTEPPNTPLPINTESASTAATTPTSESTPDSTPDSTATTDAPVTPTDLSATAVAPPGLKWVTFVPADAAGLYGNTIIGSLVTSYAAGELDSTTDTSITASIYVVTLSTPFTPEYVKAYQHWEAVDKPGTDVTTPGGLTVHQQIGAFEGTDCAVYTSGSKGLALCVVTGVDGLSLIDQYVAANPF